MKKEPTKAMPLRLPMRLYEKLTKLAEQDNRSKNSMVAQLIDEKQVKRQTG